MRLRLLFPDSAAGALFLVFGVFTLALSDISIRAKSPTAGTKAETVGAFVVKREAFMQPIISHNRQNGHCPSRGIPASLLRRLASDLDQSCFILRHVSEIAGESRARNTE